MYENCYDSCGCCSNSGTNNFSMSIIIPIILFILLVIALHSGDSFCE